MIRCVFIPSPSIRKITTCSEEVTGHDGENPLTRHLLSSPDFCSETISDNPESENTLLRLDNVLHESHRG